jgi:enoyl-CoA hydratase/carnithine racemase
MRRVRKEGYKMTESIQLFELSAQEKKIGLIRLNRPQALNALTLQMFQSLSCQLRIWAEDPEIALIVFTSASEKAFCAGGDVKSLALSFLNEELSSSEALSQAKEYFKWEYGMDYFIHRYPKPILTWGDGIVMGGGLGLSMGASHRVVTERSLLAMPEISIGFFPDVGSGYFLNQIQEGLGLFLGWTGARLQAGDALGLGWADYQIASNQRDSVFKSLQESVWRTDPAENGDILSKLLKGYDEPQVSECIEPLKDEIQKRFAQNDIYKIHEDVLAWKPENDWLKKSLETYQKGSPASARVIFEQLKKAKGKELLDVFEMEWNLALHFCERRDFLEGVTSVLIDKHFQPEWEKGDLYKIGQEEVDSYFTLFPETDEIRKFFASIQAPF